MLLTCRGSHVVAILYAQVLEGFQEGTSLSCSPDARSVRNEAKGPDTGKDKSKQSTAGLGIQRGDSAKQDDATKSAGSSETAAAEADLQAWQSKLSFMRQQVKDVPWIAEMVRTLERRHMANHIVLC